MVSEFLDNLISQAEQRFSIDSINMPTSEWITNNTTIKRRPFSYADYEFQKRIVDDWHPNLDVVKISQVGITEIQVRKALSFVVRNDGTSAIYSLPNEDMYKRVSDTRVKPIINSDKVFNTPQDKEAKAVRSQGTMQFGQSFLYIVPAIESAATSIPADVVINDEVDLSDQQMLTLFGSRMQNSKYKIHQRFSTPTFPSFGIDLNWKTSDQHFYMCKCSKCNHWQHPEFTPKFIHIPGIDTLEFDNLTLLTQDYMDRLQLESAYVRCEKCHEPLVLDDPSLREWVSRFPSRVNSRGYRIGPFSTSRLDVNYIVQSMWKYQRREFIRGFYNTVLGLPYSDGTMQIPKEDIELCLADTNIPSISKSDRLWVGIDMGQICHITLGRSLEDGTLEIVRVYEVHVDNIVEHCAELITKYNIVGGATDRHPYTPTAKDIFKVSNGKILPVEYRGSKNINLVKDEYDQLSHAQVDRTWFLDNFAGLIRKHKLRISGYGHKKETLIQHYRDMVREEKDGQPAVWAKLTGEDHYLHSGAFMAIAQHLHGVQAYRDDSDNRTCILTTTTQIRDNSFNLIGISPKRLQ